MANKLTDVLPGGVLYAVRQNMGADDPDAWMNGSKAMREADDRFNQQINEMSTDSGDSAAATLFRSFCNWHGLIGWGDTLTAALDGIRSATRKAKNNGA